MLSPSDFSLSYILGSDKITLYSIHDLSYSFVIYVKISSDNFSRDVVEGIVRSGLNSQQYKVVNLKLYTQRHYYFFLNRLALLYKFFE